MNIKRILLLGAVPAVMAACTQDEHPGKLPPGQYPLEINSAYLQLSQGQTRATIDGTWEGTEEIGLAVEGDNAVYRYNASADGKLTSSAPYYWQSTDDIEVTAWYPFNNGVKPATTVVSADQSTADLFAANDQLAATGAVSFNDSKLTFTHQTAIVVINLTGIDVEVSHNAKVSLNALSNISGGTSITPYMYSLRNNSYRAMVSPQIVPSGTDLLTVEQDGVTYIWKTEQDYDLSKNNIHTFNISLSKSTDKLILTGVTLEEWADGATVALTPEVRPEESTHADYYIDVDGTYVVYSLEGFMAWVDAAKAAPSTSCKLRCDISLPADYMWEPIGDGQNPYTGTFDGGGYTISNLNLGKGVKNAENKESIGLFGELRAPSKVVNLKLEVTRTNITYEGSGICVGYLAGTCVGGQIERVLVTFDHTKNASISVSAVSEIYLGSVVGYNVSGKILGTQAIPANGKNTTGGMLRAYVTDQIGSVWVGGLVGACFGSEAYLIASGAYISVEAICTTNFLNGGCHAGGLIGYISGGAHLQCCYVIVDNSKAYHLGALIGAFSQPNLGEVSKSYYMYLPQDMQIGASAYLREFADVFEVKDELQDKSASPLTLIPVDSLNKVLTEWNVANSNKFPWKWRYNTMESVAFTFI